MRALEARAVSVLFGSDGSTGVSRGLAEFNSGRPVFIRGRDEILLALPAEGLSAARLKAFVQMCAPGAPRLVVTAQRAAALGLFGPTPMELPIGEASDAGEILALVTHVTRQPLPHAKSAGLAAAAALEIAKMSQGLPAVLAAVVRDDVITAHPHVITVEAGAVKQFADETVEALRIASDATVPLVSGKMAHFVVFRDALGGSQTAIIVGSLDHTKPILVRLHSACLTGDVFGSRRCDCGDQLRLALARLDDNGGGIILYLAQEGRGLGLANKMRAYQLQDQGLDTVDANTTLGFNDDERDYRVAARMLEMLDCTRIVLLTNNPAKVEGLGRSGIDIVGRLSLEAPIKAENRRYLVAKAERAGHHLDHLMASLVDPS